MMNRVHLLLVFICILLLNTTRAYPSETTLAVLDFENNSFLNPEEYSPLSKGLAEIMITELNQLQAIHVVERQKLRSLLDELKLSQSGIVSATSSVQIGKMLGAQHLVFGGYMVTLDEKIRIDVRIIEVETGLTIKAGEVTGKTKQVLSLVKKLSKKILKDLNVRMTKREEKSFNKSQKLDMKAVVLFSKGLEFEDREEWEKAKEYYRKTLQIEPQFQQAKVRLQGLDGKEEAHRQ
jgi:TolB-like protein